VKVEALIRDRGLNWVRAMHGEGYLAHEGVYLGHIAGGEPRLGGQLLEGGPGLPDLGVQCREGDRADPHKKSEPPPKVYRGADVRDLVLQVG
jgi:hypothetical protein